MKILITGFDGFQGHATNPSWTMVQAISGTIGGCEIVKVQLPTKFHVAADTLEEAVSKHSPDAVVSFGLSGSSANFRVETVGWNYAGGTPDNAGVAPNGLLYRHPASVGHVCSILPRQVGWWLDGATVEAEASTNAGSYVCESLIMGWGEKVRLNPEFARIPFAFIHVMANSEDPSFGSTYKKRPLADMVASAEMILAGVAEDILGVSPPVEYSEIKPFAPVKVDPPWSYWRDRRAGEEKVVYLFRYNGGVKGAPDVTKYEKARLSIPPTGISSYGGVIDIVGADEYQVGRDVKLSAEMQDGANPHFVTYREGLGAGNPAMAAWNETGFYNTPCVCMAIAPPEGSNDVVFRGKTTTFRVTGTAADGLPFRQQFVLDLRSDPGTFLEVPWTEPAGN
ncbi:TPA: hypothetical protein ACKLO9_001531 [Neisseria gonorrhoeae]